MHLVLTEDDGYGEENDPQSEQLLMIRQAVLETLQDRSLPVADRVGALYEALGQPEPRLDRQAAARKLLELERLEQSWGEVLERWRQSERKQEPSGEAWENCQEQLLCYLVLRHLPPAAEDGLLLSRLALCVLGWQLMRNMAAGLGLNTPEEWAELTRRLSGELEYSEVNVDILLERITERLDGE